MASSDYQLPPISQLGIVVRDLEAAMEHYSKALGIGPWRVTVSAAPPMTCTLRGQPATYRVRLGIAQWGPISMELIQYLEGDSIHGEFTRTRGEGLEHVGVYVPNLDEALEAMKERGIGVLQRADGFGYSRDGRYAYLDTEATMGTVVEVIQPASQSAPPGQS